MCPCIEQSVKMLAVERCLDLLCIGTADGRDRICVNQSAFQVIGIAVSFQFVRCKIVGWKSGDILYGLHIPHTLEFQVVDRHDRFHVAEELALVELVLQKYRDQTGLPVVAVYDIRFKSDQRQC